MLADAAVFSDRQKIGSFSVKQETVHNFYHCMLFLKKLWFNN